MADESPEVALILKTLEPGYKQMAGGWMQTVTTLQEPCKQTRRSDHISMKSNTAERQINLRSFVLAMHYGYGSLHPTALQNSQLQLSRRPSSIALVADSIGVV